MRWFTTIYQLVSHVFHVTRTTTSLCCTTTWPWSTCPSRWSSPTTSGRSVCPAGASGTQPGNYQTRTNPPPHNLQVEPRLRGERVGEAERLRGQHQPRAAARHGGHHHQPGLRSRVPHHHHPQHHLHLRPRRQVNLQRESATSIIEERVGTMLRII